MNYNISINYINFLENTMIIGWSSKNIDFDQLTVYKNKTADGDMFDFDTECMSDNFRDQVLEKAIQYMTNNTFKM